MIINVETGRSTVTATYHAPARLSDLLHDNAVFVTMPCAGNHTCGKCRVEVTGAVSPPTDEEKALLGNCDGPVRLACMTTALGDCTVRLLAQEDISALSDGLRRTGTPDPLGEHYGFAVDVGTTSVAIYGYELKTGKQIAGNAFLNPQYTYGGDVIARIEAALGGKAERLSELIAGAVEKALKQLCAEQDIPTALVDTLVITGNTTMMYLLLKEDVSPLSRAPFEIGEYLGKFYAAADCGIQGFPHTRVYIPPTMSAFVGSDITCSLVTAEAMLRAGQTSLLIDIGTNGEMALSMGDRLVGCSTAAGPAFEGREITMGTVAVSGAISRVYLKNNAIEYTTVNNKPAVGVCGSGLIDAVSVFLSLGLIDDTGCINEENTAYAAYITEYDGAPALKIGNSGIVITQKDIRALQLAKAAVCAGVHSLLHAVGIRADEIDSLLLAGGFGSFIDIENAGRIGLIPRELTGKATAIGNAAGMGASSLLLFKEARQAADEVAGKAEILDLSSSAFFMDKYIECMTFPTSL